MKIAPALRMRAASRSASAVDDFQMLGRDGVDERQRLVEVAHQDHRAEIAPRGAGDLVARQSRELALDRAFDRGGETSHRR